MIPYYKNWLNYDRVQQVRRWVTFWIKSLYSLGLKLWRETLNKYGPHEIAAMGLAALLISWALIIIFSPIGFKGSEPKEATVENGYGLKQVANVLKEEGIIRSRGLFVVYTLLSGRSGDLKAGRYIFSRPVSIHGALSVISKGLSETTDILVTIPEGYNVWEIDARLASFGLIEEGEFAEKFRDKEGYLFPDTYRFRDPNLGKLSVDEIGRIMIDNFNRKTEDILKNVGFTEAGEVIVKASILEKEVRSIRDMKVVSGIIDERMERGMMLQLDATVSYGACLRDSRKNKFLENCSVQLVPVRREISIDSGYNTYIKKGFPDGPISNPGLNSIEAAINPQSSNYLFYLSTRDGSQIIYSRTGPEHEANRRKYLGI